MLEIPKSKLEFSWKKIDEGIRALDQDDDEKSVEMEFEEDEEGECEKECETKPEVAKMSWLLQSVLENLGAFGETYSSRSPATSVRIESLQVLGALCAHFLLLKDHQRLISVALVNSFNSTADEQLFVGRVLDVYGNALNVYLSQDKRHLQDLELSTEFWINMIASAVEKIQDNNQTATLRTSLVDAFANIGAHVFEKLDRKKQILLISVLTGCSYDDDSNLRVSSVRALAIYALFPSLREDLCFIENTIESVLRVVNDTNVLIRTKATWALGNIVDGLLLIRETKSINENLLRQIFDTNLAAMSDNDRVKVNAVRTIGNLITLLTKEQLSSATWITIFEKSIQNLHDLLLKCNSVKVKWNICYSFASMMKYQIFFDASLKYKWQDVVFPVLCKVIRTSPNFKVRINACTAFTVPTRQNFGIHFIEIWMCLLEALEQSNNMTDFIEYKHRDTLQDQICSSICHFLNLATADDVVRMKNEVFPLIDITKQNWNRVYNRWLPECQGKILNATTSLKGINCKTSEQKNSIDILISCFRPVEQF